MLGNHLGHNGHGSIRDHDCVPVDGGPEDVVGGKQESMMLRISQHSAPSKDPIPTSKSGLLYVGGALKVKQGALPVDDDLPLVGRSHIYNLFMLPCATKIMDL